MINVIIVLIANIATMIRQEGTNNSFCLDNLTPNQTNEVFYMEI